MAKETVTVDNNFEEIELIDTKKASSKDQKKKNEKKNDKPKKEKKTKEKKESYFSKLRTEIKLVTWPTKKNVLKYSFAAILMIILMAIFFIGISALFDLIYALVQGWIG